MKAKFPYDDIWRERLEQSEPPVPSHIWENIAKQSQKKRPFFLWPWGLNTWLFLFCILGGIGTGFYFFKSPHPSSNAQPALASSGNQKVNTNVADLSQQTINHAEEKNYSVNNNTEAASTTSNQIAEKGIYQNNLKNAFNDAASTKTITYPQHNSKEPGDTKVKVKPTALDNTFEAVASTSSSETTYKAQVIGEQSRKKVRIKKPKAISSGVNDITENEPVLDHELNLTGLGEIELLSLNQYRPQSTITSKLQPRFEIPCPNADLNPAWNKEYVDFYSSADYVIRQFNDTPNSSYMQMRKQSTRFSSAFSVGARYNKVFENGLSFRVGLNYSQINEKFQFVQGNIIQLQYILNANGDTIGSYEAVFKRYKTSYNHYRTVDIPITVGYEKMFGKCTMNFGAGIVFNAYSWNRGEVLDNNLQPVNINSTDSTNPYQLRTNIGIGGIASASFYYPINEKWKVFAEPYLRYNFSSMSSAELSLKQKYHTAGLKLGLRIDLK